MKKQAIWECRPEDRSEIAVARRIVAGQFSIKRYVLLAVVSDGVDIVAPGAEKPIHQSIVIFDASAVVGMVGTRMRASGVITGKRMRRVGHACGVYIGQASLLTVGIRQPAEKMLETAVFHRYDDDVLD